MASAGYEAKHRHTPSTYNLGSAYGVHMFTFLAFHKKNPSGLGKLRVGIKPYFFLICQFIPYACLRTYLSYLVMARRYYIR
jgi:hypothetical protein